MNEPKERGEASLRIELKNGNIQVFHGTDKVLLLDCQNVPAGSWQELWKLLYSFAEGI